MYWSSFLPTLPDSDYWRSYILTQFHAHTPWLRLLGGVMYWPSFLPTLPDSDYWKSYVLTQFHAHTPWLRLLGGVNYWPSFLPTLPEDLCCTPLWSKMVYRKIKEDHKVAMQRKKTYLSELLNKCWFWAMTPCKLYDGNSEHNFELSWCPNRGSPIY